MRNNSMTQEEHISLLQRRRKKDSVSVLEEINKKYEKYVQGDDCLLEDIMDALDKKYRGTVSHQLYAAGCYDDENEHTAMQEARMGVWKLLQKSRSEQKIEQAFAAQCKGIYYHKVMDVIRDVLSTNKKWDGGISSLDIELPSENGTVASLIADRSHGGNRPDLVLEDEAKREFFDSAFTTYCQALTNSDAEPPRCLALHYSRILPHILHIYFEVDTIPDSKASSPKWAIEKMGKRTIGVLGNESESQLRKYVSGKLHWCDSFLKQLNTEISTSVGLKMMKNIIYTDQYDEKQIGHMTDYMHKTVVQDWLELMKKQSVTVEEAIDYTVGSAKISKVLRGGR